MTPELIERLLENAHILPALMLSEAATQGAADNARIASLQDECNMWCSKANERQLRIAELEAKLAERTAEIVAWLRAERKDWGPALDAVATAIEREFP
jgi:hypothetical protein